MSPENGKMLSDISLSHMFIPSSFQILIYSKNKYITVLVHPEEEFFGISKEKKLVGLYSSWYLNAPQKVDLDFYFVIIFLWTWKWAQPLLHLLSVKSWHPSDVSPEVLIVNQSREVC